MLEGCPKTACEVAHLCNVYCILLHPYLYQIPIIYEGLVYEGPHRKKDFPLNSIPDLSDLMWVLTICQLPTVHLLQVAAAALLMYWYVAQHMCSGMPPGARSSMIP